MSEEKRKEEEKSKHNILVTPVGIAFPEKLDYGVALTAVSGSIAEGYNRLSSTFDASQATIAQSFNLEENIKQLVDLTKEQVTHSKTESKNRKKQWYITTAIALIAVLIAVISLLKTFKII